MSKLNVIIITQGVSRIVEPVRSNTNVVGIIETESKNIRKIARWKKNLLDIIKSASHTFNLGSKNLKSYARERNIPYYLMSGGSNLHLEEWVRRCAPDLIVVYMMSELLKCNIYELPKYKTINLHPSLLPNYRGPNPWFWAYYNMDKTGGITLHYIDDGEDTGDIIYQQTYDIPLGIKSPALNDLVIGELGVSLVLKALNSISNLPKTKQNNNTDLVRARNIKKSEHQNIIDWNNWPIERIWHILRGTELWLNALKQPTGFYKGQRWIICEFENIIIDNYQYGRIYKENGRWFVACKGGKIFLELKFNLKNGILFFLK